MNIKEIIIGESNSYFERNVTTRALNDEPSQNARLVSRFISGLKDSDIGSNINRWKVCEIGCCYGYNLNFLSKEHGFELFGCDPSNEAIDFGINRWPATSKINLIQGISNRLPYEDNQFDMVIAGFLLYVTPREIIPETICEMNRVLKEGGFLVLTDFDTQIPYIRVNKHNESMPVFKEDYANRFLTMGYYLAEKYSYSHAGTCFNPDIQERVSTQILYKEKESTLYVNA